jgi:hypothetical protein
MYHILYDGFLIVVIFFKVDAPRRMRTAGNRISELLPVRYPTLPNDPNNRNAAPVSPRLAIPRLIPIGARLNIEITDTIPSGISIRPRIM